MKCATLYQCVYVWDKLPAAERERAFIMIRHIRAKSKTKPAKLLAKGGGESSSKTDATNRPKNVIGALFNHFQQWRPEVLNNASEVQEMCEESTS